MTKVTFITGNQGKADFLAKYVDYPVEHQKVDIDEIQSLNLSEVAEHKVRQAYEVVGRPVLVEDVALVFEALKDLPGPFIKWFEIAIGAEGICRLLDGKSRKAAARVCMVYFDGHQLEFFDGQLEGRIANNPIGTNGFGFDPIFIPEGFDITLAEMSDDQLQQNSLRTTTIYPELARFLHKLDKN